MMRSRQYDEPDEDELFCYSQGYKHGKLGPEHYAGHSSAYEFKRTYNKGFEAGRRASMASVRHSTVDTRGGN